MVALVGSGYFSIDPIYNPDTVFRIYLHEGRVFHMPVNLLNFLFLYKAGGVGGPPVVERPLNKVCTIEESLKTIIAGAFFSSTAGRSQADFQYFMCQTAYVIFSQIWTPVVSHIQHSTQESSVKQMWEEIE